MGHGLHHALVQVQAGGDEAFAVSGGAGACDPRAFGQLRLNLLDDVDGGGQRAAFVVGVAGPDDFTVVVDERGLDGGGTGVDAQEVRAVRAFEGADVDVFLVVALVEVLAVGPRWGTAAAWWACWRAGSSARPNASGFRRRCRPRNGGPDRRNPCRPAMPNRRPTYRWASVGTMNSSTLPSSARWECGAQLGHEEQRAAEEDDGAVNRGVRKPGRRWSAWPLR